MCLAELVQILKILDWFNCYPIDGIEYAKTWYAEQVKGMQDRKVRC